MKRMDIFTPLYPAYPHLLFGLGCFGIILAIAFGLIYMKHFGLSLSQEQEVWAQFGEFYGGALSALLALLALMALLYTAYIQVSDARQSQWHAERQLNQSLLQEQSADILKAVELIRQDIDHLLDLATCADPEVTFRDYLIDPDPTILKERRHKIEYHPRGHDRRIVNRINDQLVMMSMFLQHLDSNMKRLADSSIYSAPGFYYKSRFSNCALRVAKLQGESLEAAGLAAFRFKQYGFETAD